MRRFMKLWAILAVFTFYMLGFVGVMSAQDVTPEVTARPTAEVTPVVTPAPVPSPLTPENAISIVELLRGIAIAVLGGGSVFVILTRFSVNKTNLDAMEKLYQAQSPDAQERERQLFMGLRDITLRMLDIVDKVTDGQPNAEISVGTPALTINTGSTTDAQNAAHAILDAIQSTDSNVG